MNSLSIQKIQEIISQETHKPDVVIFDEKDIEKYKSFVLEVTPSELEDIIDGDYKRFLIIKDNIPEQYQFEFYTKNSRVYKACFFIDIENFKGFYIEYSWHTEFGYEFPTSIISLPDDIKLVSKSVLHPELEPEIVETPEPELTPLEKELKDLYDKYNSFEKKDFDTVIRTIPESKLVPIKEAFNTLTLSQIPELKLVLFRVAVEYEIEVDTLKNYCHKHIKTTQEKLDKEIKRLHSLAKKHGYKLIKI